MPFFGFEERTQMRTEAFQSFIFAFPTIQPFWA